MTSLQKDADGFYTPQTASKEETPPETEPAPPPPAGAGGDLFASSFEVTVSIPEPFSPKSSQNALCR